MRGISLRLGRLEGRRGAQRSDGRPIVLADPALCDADVTAFVTGLIGPVEYWRLHRPGMTKPRLGSLDDASDDELQQAIDTLDSLIVEYEEPENEHRKTTAKT